MSEELREKVARRLVQVLMESLGAKEQALGILPPGGKISWGTKPDPDVFPSMPSLDFLPVADEVIRQMEWARIETTFVTPGADYDEWHVGFNDLTLAPPDWKP